MLTELVRQGYLLTNLRPPFTVTTPIEGVPFTEEAVRRMLKTEPMTPSGAGLPRAGLEAHRDALGL